MFSCDMGFLLIDWWRSDLKELPDIFDRRLDACNKLESAESALLCTAAKLRRKESKSKGSAAAAPDGTTAKAPVNPSTSDPESGTVAALLVPREKRPTHRLKLGFMPFALPFIGKKVDSIEWAREEIRVCNELLKKGREIVEGEDVDKGEAVSQDIPMEGGSKTAEPVKPTYPPYNSAFVTFHQQIAANMALRTLAHHEPYKMSGLYGEISPEDVIWGNVGLNPYEQKV
jgi:hypothetical protein